MGGLDGRLGWAERLIDEWHGFSSVVHGGVR